MNTTPLTDIAPDIFRKRLLFEGYFTIEVSARNSGRYFSYITAELGLRTYGDPIVHKRVARVKMSMKDSTALCR